MKEKHPVYIQQFYSYERNTRLINTYKKHLKINLPLKTDTYTSCTCGTIFSAYTTERMNQSSIITLNPTLKTR